jgi:hypothetical protein
MEKRSIEITENHVHIKNNYNLISLYLFNMGETPICNIACTDQMIKLLNCPSSSLQMNVYIRFNKVEVLEQIRNNYLFCKVISYCVNVYSK